MQTPWWMYLVEHRDSIRQCSALWGGVTAGPKAFDAALYANNASGMWHILNEVWSKAPDDPVIHRQEGWKHLCNLLDNTVPGPDNDNDDDDS